MEVGREYKILVAEPWDFTSSEGDNLFTIKIRRKINSNKELFIAKVRKPFRAKDLEINYVLLSQRHIVNDRGFNIYYLSNDNYFNDVELMNEKLVLIAIGEIKDFM